MNRWIRSLAFVALASVAAEGRARAQGAVVHGTIAASTSDGSVGPSFGGAVGYRFNRALGLEVELSHLRSIPSNYPSVYCCGRDDDEGRTTVFTTNVRLEIPTTLRRVLPFVVGGGGAAAETRGYDLYYALAQELASRGVPGGLDFNLFVPGAPREIRTTSTSLALTLGGGASFLVTDRFSVDADLRVLHIMESDKDRSIGRFGGGVSYRF
jgi:opacity protein-like surface antigen